MELVQVAEWRKHLEELRTGPRPVMAFHEGMTIGDLIQIMNDQITWDNLHQASQVVEQKFGTPDPANVGTVIGAPYPARGPKAYMSGTGDNLMFGAKVTKDGKTYVKREPDTPFAPAWWQEL